MQFYQKYSAEWPHWQPETSGFPQKWALTPATSCPLYQPCTFSYDANKEKWPQHPKISISSFMHSSSHLKFNLSKNQQMTFQNILTAKVRILVHNTNFCPFVQSRSPGGILFPSVSLTLHAESNIKHQALCICICVWYNMLLSHLSRVRLCVTP